MNVHSPPEEPKRDSARTRERILRAAQMLFARQGYTTTGVRQVAAEAGVNSTLIRRYFASKEGLFRAAVEDMLQVEPFIAGSREDFGRRSVDVLAMGEDLPSALAMMILATADTEVRGLCSELLHRLIILPLAEWLGGKDAPARAARIDILWIGYMAARQVLPLTALETVPISETRDWLARTIQAIVDENE